MQLARNQKFKVRKPHPPSPSLSKKSLKKPKKPKPKQTKQKDHSQLPGHILLKISCNVFTTLVNLSTLTLSSSNAFTTLRCCSRIAPSCAATSPGSSTRCFTLGSGSSALRLISSRRSGRPRRNLWCENSQVWASVEVRWARGVCMGCFCCFV